MLCISSAGAQQQVYKPTEPVFASLTCKQTVKNSVLNAPKMAVLRYKLEKFSRLWRFDPRDPVEAWCHPAALELATVLTVTGHENFLHGITCRNYRIIC